MNDLTEGDPCPECGGILEFPPVENCYCHITAPCSACVENPLTCNTCGWTPEKEPFQSGVSLYIDGDKLVTK